MITRRKFLILSFCALMLVAFAAVRLVDVYDLSWWTPEGGGGGDCYQGASGYALCGAVGHSDAGSGSGSGYQVQSGFWVGPRLVHYQLMLPLIRR